MPENGMILKSNGRVTFADLKPHSPSIMNDELTVTSNESKPLFYFTSVYVEYFQCLLFHRFSIVQLNKS